MRKHHLKQASRVLFVLVVMLILDSRTAAAQQLYAQLSGTVVDHTGVVVPDAKLTITNTTTGVSLSTETDQEGRFSLTVAPGVYDIRVEVSGFAVMILRSVPVNANG